MKNGFSQRGMNFLYGHTVYRLTDIKISMIYMYLISLSDFPNENTGNSNLIPYFYFFMKIKFMKNASKIKGVEITHITLWF